MSRAGHSLLKRDFFQGFFLLDIFWFCFFSCITHSFLLCCIKVNFTVPLKHTLYWELKMDSLCSFSKSYLSLYSTYIVLFSQLFQASLWGFFLKFTRDWTPCKSVCITDTLYFRIGVKKIYAEICFKIIAFFSSNSISKIFRNAKLMFWFTEKKKKLVNL